MKNKEKVHIFEYSPELYPVLLYITFDNNLKSILDNFEDVDKKPLIAEWGDDTTVAITWRILKYKETGSNSILITFRDNTKKDYEIMAHECSHAADHVWQLLGESGVSGEANAYLVQWLMKCCIDASKRTVKHKKQDKVNGKK